MTKLLYGLCLLALLLLALSFASFFLVTFEQLDFLQPIVEYSTAYLPVLLLPTVGVMAVLLLLRYLGKGKDEVLGFGDFFAGLLALALQIGAILVWRAQGNEIAGPLAANIPEVEFLSENASRAGVLGVALLQFLAFVFYWIADPDPKPED